MKPFNSLYSMVLLFVLLIGVGQHNASGSTSPEITKVILKSVDNAIEGVEIKAAMKMIRYDFPGLQEDSVKNYDGPLPQKRERKSDSSGGYTQERNLTITYAGGKTDAVHQVFESEKSDAFSYTEFYGLQEFATDATNPTTGKKTHMISERARLISFLTPVCHTFGRGLSCFADLPLQFEKIQGSDSLYQLKIPRSEKPFWGSFILDQTKNFCWTEGEFFNGPPGQEHKDHKKTFT